METFWTSFGLAAGYGLQRQRPASSFCVCVYLVYCFFCLRHFPVYICSMPTPPHPNCLIKSCSKPHWRPLDWQGEIIKDTNERKANIFASAARSTCCLPLEVPSIWQIWHPVYWCSCASAFIPDSARPRGQESALRWVGGREGGREGKRTLIIPIKGRLSALPPPSPTLLAALWIKDVTDGGLCVSANEYFVDLH